MNQPTHQPLVTEQRINALLPQFRPFAERVAHKRVAGKDMTVYVGQFYTAIRETHAHGVRFRWLVSFRQNDGQMVRRTGVVLGRKDAESCADIVLLEVATLAGENLQKYMTQPGRADGVELVTTALAPVATRPTLLERVVALLPEPLCVLLALVCMALGDGISPRRSAFELSEAA